VATGIYFSGSIRGGRADASVYRSLISYLRGYGEVLTEHIGDSGLDANGQVRCGDREIHDRDLELLHGSRAVVAEVTCPSLGVGYEIGRAVASGIPVLALHRGPGCSAMIAGSPGVRTVVYDHIEQAYRAVDDLFRRETR
jgi:hypothetical protein